MKIKRFHLLALLISLLVTVFLIGCTTSGIRSAVETYLNQWARNNGSPYEILKYDHFTFDDKNGEAIVVVLTNNNKSILSGGKIPIAFYFEVYKIDNEWIAEPKRNEISAFDVEILYENGNECIEKFQPELDDRVCFEITNNSLFDWKFPERELVIAGGTSNSVWSNNGVLYDDLEIGRYGVIQYKTFLTYEDLISQEVTYFGISDGEMWLFLLRKP